jgi:transcriptional regulator with XRE-family HTH domain
MAHEDIPKNIAKNITELRKNAGMTQARLAEEIGYSDKSVSKWERGEGVPDIVCLKNIADMFGVTVDYLLESEHTSSPALSSDKRGEQQPTESYVINRAAIVGVTLAGVFMLAAIVFVILKICDIVSVMPFVIACPVFAILMVIFNSVWGTAKLNFYTISLLVIAILFLISFLLRSYDMWSIMLLCIPGVLIVWLACRVKTKKSE